MPVTITMQGVATKGPRYFGLSSEYTPAQIAAWTAPINIASGRTQGTIIAGAFLTIISGVVELAIAGDPLYGYVTAVRGPVGSPLQSPFILNDDSGVVDFIKLTPGGPLFEAVEDAANLSLSIVTLAAAIPAQIGQCYVDLVTTAAGSDATTASLNKVPVHSPTPIQKLKSSTCSTSAAQFKLQQLVQDGGNVANPFRFLVSPYETI